MSPDLVARLAATIDAPSAIQLTRAPALLVEAMAAIVTLCTTAAIREAVLNEQIGVLQREVADVRAKEGPR